MKIFNFKIIIEHDETGYFVASVPSIPGCHTQGKTYEEALKYIKEAIMLCLEVAKDNPEYRAKIEFPTLEKQPKFLGIAEIPIRFNMS